MGHNLCLHFWADEHPYATYFDVHQGYRVFTRHVTPLSLEIFARRPHVEPHGDEGPEGQESVDGQDLQILRDDRST